MTVYIPWKKAVRGSFSLQLNSTLNPKNLVKPRFGSLFVHFCLGFLKVGISKIPKTHRKFVGKSRFEIFRCYWTMKCWKDRPGSLFCSWTYPEVLFSVPFPWNHSEVWREYDWSWTSLEDYQRDQFRNLGFRAFRIRFMRKVSNMQPNWKDPFHGKFQAKRLIQKCEWFTQFSVLYIPSRKSPVVDVITIRLKVVFCTEEHAWVYLIRGCCFKRPAKNGV